MGAIGREIAKKVLTKRSKEFNKQFPQLACFSSDAIGLYINLDGRYELELLQALKKKIYPQLPDTKVCLDIGANIGNHSSLFAEDFNEVLSFEPNKRTFQLLACNAELFNNVTAINLGLSDKTSTQTAYFSKSNVGAASIHMEPGPNKIETSFKLMPLDEVPQVQQLKQIDFVKIDVERHELNCIIGAEQTFKKHSPVIAMEVLQDEIENGTTTAISKLKEYGYSHFYNFVSTRPLSWAPKAISKLSTALIGLTTNYQPPKNFKLVNLELTADQNYPLIICSKTPLETE